MRNKNLIRMIFLVGLLLYGCRNTGRVTDEFTASYPIVSPSSSPGEPEPTKSETIAHTDISPAEEATPSPNPTKTGEIQSTTESPPITLTSVITQCIQILQEESQASGISGSLVLGQHDGSLDPVILDLADDSQYPFPQNDSILTLSVSPEGSWVAYVGQSPSGSGDFELIVRSINENEVISFPLDYVKGAYPFGWIDNNRILLIERKGNAMLDVPIVLNPFEGSLTSLPPDYPEIVDDDYVYRFWPGLTIYSNDLSMVMYLAESESAGDKLVLYNRESNTVITEVLYIGFTHDPPSWSPKNNGFFFVMAPTWAPEDRLVENFLFAGIDGQITQLTHFSEIHEQAEIISYELSPDGNSIAFWLNQVITVLNLETNRVTNYCINTYGLPYKPVWSLNGQYLAIGTVDQTGTARTLILDLDRTIAIQIAEGAYPIGWVETRP